MLKKCISTAALAGCLGFSALANAQEPVDTRFYVAPLASYGFFNEDSFEPDDNIGAQLSIGKTLTRHLALELFAFNYQDVDAERGLGSSSANIDIYGYGLSALLFPARDVFPVFAIVGIGEGQHDFDQRTAGPAGLNDQDSDFVDVGAGFLAPINDYGIAIRGEYRYRTSDVDAPGGGEYKFRDHIASLGLHIPLGAKPTAPPPPPAKPAPRPAPAAPVDSDGDGVPDRRDQCPDTPRGTPVNSNGCPIEKAAPIILKGVTFEFDSARLTGNARSRLDNVVNSLKDNNINIRAEGHTDSIGSAAYNQRLSQDRADAVKRYLVDHGISSGRLTTKGFGETRPIAPNTKPNGADNPAGRAQNRRTELHVTE